jgi:hypothetical protein
MDPLMRSYGQQPGKERWRDERRDSALGDLLRSSAQPRELISRTKLEYLVASAPPAKAAWWAGLAVTTVRPLRYAVALSLVLGLCVGTLAVMPAQSDQVGTIVLSSLPAAWQVGGSAFEEVRSAADQRFQALGVPQGALYVWTAARQGRDELAFIMLGVEPGVARQFYEGLSRDYPALGPFKADYQPINSGQYGSKLNELLVQLAGQGQRDRLSDTELKKRALLTCGAAGLTDVEATVKHLPDGKIVIEVEATLQLNMDGHSREDLEAAGLDEALLGTETYQRLLNELALP